MQDDIIGMKVEIAVSDPWEFETETGTGTLYAKILQVGMENSAPAILLQVENPVKYKNMVCEYFVASPRHTGTDLSTLLNDSEVFCALTLIPSDRIKSENPFDLSWWRGGVALIATVKISN
jgi:hypothetical protein